MNERIYKVLGVIQLERNAGSFCNIVIPNEFKTREMCSMSCNDDKDETVRRDLIFHPKVIK